MHAFSHSLAHRAPPATRTRVRWQPYTTISTQCSSSSSSTSSNSPSSQLSTPSSSVTSPPSNTPFSEIKLSNHPTHNHKETALPPKNKYAVGLVDQAVKTLCEIWRPQDIPPIFLASSRPGTALGASTEPSSNKITQLSSHRIAGCVSAVPSMSPALTASAYGNDPRASLVPIKGFVHEVIRRSRTSGSVLQTALCYLEAIRVKIPDILQKEQSGQGVQGEPDLSSRITPATELEIQELKIEEQKEDLLCLDPDLTPAPCGDYMAPTMRINDIEPTESSSLVEEDVPPQFSNLTDSALPPMLPSPLLCPRRAFLASLILASKFTQDKCYSNRAWAKLSGLPAREIGRCERALGEALDWRLWVGKSPAQPQQLSGPSISNSNPSNRPIARSQSESNILTPPSARSPFLVRSDARHPPALPGAQRILQRSSTMPAESFTTSSGSWSPIDPRATSLKCSQPSITGPLAPPTAMAAVHAYAEALSQSPSPDNPGLSYSPSSTESSSGDRTIQMSTFLDEPMAPYSIPQAPTSTEFWPWSDNADASVSPLTITQNNRTVKVPIAPENPGIYPSTILGGDYLSHGGFLVTPNSLWSTEGETHRSLALMTQ